MSDTVIRVEDVSRQYRLGNIGTGTFGHDLNRWWHSVRGKEAPYLKIDEINNRSKKGIEFVKVLKAINLDVTQTSLGQLLAVIRLSLYEI